MEKKKNKLSFRFLLYKTNKKFFGRVVKKLDIENLKLL